MHNPKIFSFIKTECGRAKYFTLSKKKGFLAKLRLFWFVSIATFRDWNIPKTNQSDELNS